MTDDYCVTVEGVTYPSLRVACEAYGLTRSQLNLRRRSRPSIEDALTAPFPYAHDPVEVAGKKYPTATDACHDLGLNIKRVMSIARRNFRTVSEVIEDEMA